MRASGKWWNVSDFIEFSAYIARLPPEAFQPKEEDDKILHQPIKRRRRPSSNADRRRLLEFA